MSLITASPARTAPPIPPCLQGLSLGGGLPAAVKSSPHPKRACPAPSLTATVFLEVCGALATPSPRQKRLSSGGCVPAAVKSSPRPKRAFLAPSLAASAFLEVCGALATPSRLRSSPVVLNSSDASDNGLPRAYRPAYSSASAGFVFGWLRPRRPSKPPHPKPPRRRRPQHHVSLFGSARNFSDAFPPSFLLRLSLIPLIALMPLNTESPARTAPPIPPRLRGCLRVVASLPPPKAPAHPKRALLAPSLAPSPRRVSLSGVARCVSAAFRLRFVSEQLHLCRRQKPPRVPSAPSSCRVSPFSRCGVLHRLLLLAVVRPPTR